MSTGSRAQRPWVESLRNICGRSLDGAGGTTRKIASVPAGAIFRNHVSGADQGGPATTACSGDDRGVLARPALRVLGLGVVRERADAARNRLRVLAAAERLFAVRGVAGVTMDEVAATAGVGKGTLYRRFGDKGGLATALLNEREGQLQQRMLFGEPPLGPGAPPAARLAAFVAAYLDRVAAQLDLVLLAETSTRGAGSAPERTPSGDSTAASCCARLGPLNRSCARTSSSPASPPNRSATGSTTSTAASPTWSGG